MKFTLVYEGVLLSDRNDRAAHKQSIRKQFHPQLKLLWQHKLSHWLDSNQVSAYRRRWDAGPPKAQQLGEHFQAGGFQFVPLVAEHLTVACSLDILFLRRGVGLGKIVQGGDIDNRLKTLFDGLRIPKEEKEIGNVPIEDDEKPFFCLLEDDGLITEVKIKADTLLTPRISENDDDVKLIIGVTVTPLQALEHNMDFA